MSLADTWLIPERIPCAVPDGPAGWLLVHHDGDGEVGVTRNLDGTFRLGATSGQWQIGWSADPPGNVTRVTG